MSKKIGNILLALESLHATGGFSYSFVTGELNPTTGFTVAVSKENEKILHNLDTLTKEQIKQDAHLYALSHMEELVNKNRFFGAWTSENKLYLDVSEIVKTRKEAVKLCQERQQIAYWDNAAGEAVEIN